MTPLPAPMPEAAAHSRQLAARIRGAIQDAGGALPFVEFMHLALYAPGLGYYSAGARKFGADGDFVTAPEISPLFARCLARPCRDVLRTLDDGVIMEFGAGSGQLAADLLAELRALDCLPARYWILEVSPDLRARQQQTLQARIPELAGRVQWLEALPEPVQGVVLANEVLDAMPVQRFHVDEHGAVEEYCVTLDDNSFAWQRRPAGELLTAAVQALDLPPDYSSEFNPNLFPWLNALSASLAAGLILLIDYGFPRAEYYHPQRSSGTLACHYRHYHHGDPFFLPGLQDITAHVDFTAVAEAALACDLAVAGYTSQADFLLASGLESLLQEADPLDTVRWLHLTQGAKKLIMPEEMGELFKVIALTRGAIEPVQGFARDRRGRL